MLEVSEEVYKKILAEEEEYARLLEKNRRRDLLRHLGFRTWLTGAATLAAAAAGIVPRFRFLLPVAAVLFPLFVWQFSLFVRREKWAEEILAAEAEERRLKALEERREIRENLLAQKAAQEEIERLRAEIDHIKKGETSS